jgi:hypothetical protein
VIRRCKDIVVTTSTRAGAMKMASQRTYECFACKRLGFSGVLVYLDGKDDEGRTKYLNKDMTSHIHQGIPISTQQPPSQQISKEEIIPLLRIIDAKLDRLLTDVSGNNEEDDDERLGAGMLIE